MALWCAGGVRERDLAVISGLNIDTCQEYHVLTGVNNELMVLSASIIRSDFRQRLANLIHMTVSSSGFKTSVRTCNIRCHTSTSG